MKLQGVSDLFNRQGMDLTISHVPTGFVLAFPAFLDLMSDAYTCDWDEEAVFGRMDSIPTFRSTRRTLSLAWHVPAESFNEAMANVEKVNKLISYLYPLYDKVPGPRNNSATGGATAINQSPLVRISFGNLVQNSVDGRGLLGWLSGITFDPALEFGMFNRKGGMPDRRGGRRLRGRLGGLQNASAKTNLPFMAQDNFIPEPGGYIIEGYEGGFTRGTEPPVNEYYPKTFRLNLQLTVLHEHELGFKHVKNNLGKYQHLDRDVTWNNFPYYSEWGATTDLAEIQPAQEAQDLNLIKAKYNKLSEQGDPTLPGNVQAVDLSVQIENEGDAVAERKRKEKPRAGGNLPRGANSGLPGGRGGEGYEGDFPVVPDNRPNPLAGGGD